MIYEFFPVPVLIKQLPQQVIDEALTSSARVHNELDNNQDGHFNNYSVLHEGVNVPRDYPLLYKEICIAKQEFLDSTGLDADEANIKSWIQEYKTEKNYHEEHHHGVYGLSGVFYITANKQAGKLKLRSPNPMCKYQHARYDTKYTTEITTIEPTPGMFVLFASYLLHEAEHGLPGVEKKILAFNLGDHKK